MAKIERYLEIESIEADAFSLPEIIRVKVSSKREAKQRKTELIALLKSARKKACYHVHRHGTPSQPCSREELI